MISRFIGATALCALCGCDAGHLGNPLTLPTRAVANSVQNASYNARRARVSAFVVTHHPTLIAEIKSGRGAHLQQAMGLARVPASDHAALTARLASDIALYRRDPEALVVAFMVHGG